MDNLCIFDEVIKSETSFHCTICNKCSDNYDHHCPFIDNCLGTRNHKYFLIFIVTYFIYSLLVIGAAGFRFYTFLTDGRGVYADTFWTMALFFLIVLPLPVLIFQLKEQCSNLSKRQTESKIIETGPATESVFSANVAKVFRNQP